VKFLYDFKLPKLSLFISILSKVLQSSNLFPLFPPSTKTNHSSPTKEIHRNKFPQNLRQKLCLEKKNQMTQIHAFKKDEKEVGEKKLQLGGLWKVPMLGGLWKVPMFGDF
jgi:hypothetical protein